MTSVAHPTGGRKDRTVRDRILRGESRWGTAVLGIITWLVEATP